MQNLGAGPADLHLHSTASDGHDRPSVVMRRAARAGIAVLALTDHDTVAGLAEAADEALSLGLNFVPGAELSADFAGLDAHLIALDIDPAHPRLAAHEAGLRRERERRARAMVDRLDRRGLGVSIAAIEGEAGGAPWGRPHIARALVRAGRCSSEAEAFRRFLGRRGLAYVAKQAPPAALVIDTIHAAGGLAVLAHPGSSGITEDLLRQLAALGLDGVEVVHPEQSPSERESWRRLAGELGLALSGGSDDHGGGRRQHLGQVSVPAAWLDSLRAARRAVVAL